MDEKLTLNHVSVHFGGLRAIENVSADFRSNAITGLIGPNGAGKTTLVSAITGFVDITRGEISFGQVRLSKTRPDLIVKHGIARTFQVPGVPGELTVKEILDTTIYHTSKHVQRLGFSNSADIAAFCKIEKFLEVKCNSLTLPQLRRLEIARALSSGPKLLLLDEVMAGLGLGDVQETSLLIRKINKFGIGVVMIEHVMSIIRDLCQDVIVLNHGKILTRGEPEIALQSPEVQKAYLGEDINFDDV